MCKYHAAKHIYIYTRAHKHTQIKSFSHIHVSTYINIYIYICTHRFCLHKCKCSVSGIIRHFLGPPWDATKTSLGLGKSSPKHLSWWTKNLVSQDRILSKTTTVQFPILQSSPLHILGLPSHFPHEGLIHPTKKTWSYVQLIVDRRYFLIEGCIMKTHMKGYGLVHLISAPYEALNVCSCLIWWVVREAQKPGRSGGRMGPPINGRK